MTYESFKTHTQVKLEKTRHNRRIELIAEVYVLSCNIRQRQVTNHKDSCQLARTERVMG